MWLIVLLAMERRTHLGQFFFNFPLSVRLTLLPSKPLGSIFFNFWYNAPGCVKLLISLGATEKFKKKLLDTTRTLSAHWSWQWYPAVGSTHSQLFGWFLRIYGSTLSSSWKKYQKTWMNNCLVLELFSFFQ